MNIGHLGDALDHWKGCIIGMLEKHLTDVHIIPMFTDENVEHVWTEQRLRLYSGLLQVNQVSTDKILKPKDRFTAASRKDYFSDIANDERIKENDLFIDPDTGIAPRSGGDSRHVRATDIAKLLPSNSTRVLLIYQHSSREDDWTDACLQRVVAHNNLNDCSAFAYWAGSASMIFVSRHGEQKRLIPLHQSLSELGAVLPEECIRVTRLIPD